MDHLRSDPATRISSDQLSALLCFHATH